MELTTIHAGGGEHGPPNDESGGCWSLVGDGVKGLVPRRSQRRSPRGVMRWPPIRRWAARLGAVGGVWAGIPGKVVGGAGDA